MSRLVTQTQWASFLACYTCHATEPSPDIMAHVADDSGEVLGAVVYHGEQRTYMIYDETKATPKPGEAWAALLRNTLAEIEQEDNA